MQTAISQATGSLPVDLPSPPTFSKTNPNDQPIMYIALTSDSVTRGQLYDYGSTQVGQRISILPGVSRVNVFGTKSAIRIKADPSAHVGARHFDRRSVARRSRAAPATPARASSTAVSGTALLRPQGQLDSAEAYSNLIVGSTNGAPVYLRDVATVQRLGSGRAVNMRFWVRGYPVPGATVVVAVYRQAGANAVEVAKSIRDLLPHDQRRVAGIGAHHADLRPLARASSTRSTTCR